MTFQIECVELVIENEIDQGLSQRQVAMTYALAIRDGLEHDWARMNAAISKRWPKGLNRVKAMAWKLVEE